MKQVADIIAMLTRFKLAMMAAYYDLFEEWRLDLRPRAARHIERVDSIDKRFAGMINNRHPHARSRIVKKHPNLLKSP